MIWWSQSVKQLRTLGIRTHLYIIIYIYTQGISHVGTGAMLSPTKSEIHAQAGYVSESLETSDLT